MLGGIHIGLFVTRSLREPVRCESLWTPGRWCEGSGLGARLQGRGRGVREEEGSVVWSREGAACGRLGLAEGIAVLGSSCFLSQERPFIPG